MFSITILSILAIPVSVISSSFLIAFIVVKPVDVVRVAMDGCIVVIGIHSAVHASVAAPLSLLGVICRATNAIPATTMPQKSLLLPSCLYAYLRGILNNRVAGRKVSGCITNRGQEKSKNSFEV